MRLEVSADGDTHAATGIFLFRQHLPNMVTGGARWIAGPLHGTRISTTITTA